MIGFISITPVLGKYLRKEDARPVIGHHLQFLPFPEKLLIANEDDSAMTDDSICYRISSSCMLKGALGEYTLLSSKRIKSPNK